MKKWIKLTKNWFKMEKNEFLYGKIIKSQSKNGRFLLKNYRKTRKKVVFNGKLHKIHGKVVKSSKKWSKIEKNQLLFGENIKFHSKIVCFLLKNYRRTRKNVQNS